MIYTIIVLFIISVVLYTRLKNKKDISTLDNYIDLEEPLNGNMDNVSYIPNIFLSIFNKHSKKPIDTYLPEFTEDTHIELVTGSSPITDKFTQSGNTGFFVYKEEHKPPTNNEIDTHSFIYNNRSYQENLNHKIHTLTSEKSLTPTKYYDNSDHIICEDNIDIV